MCSVVWKGEAKSLFFLYDGVGVIQLGLGDTWKPNKTNPAGSLNGDKRYLPGHEELQLVLFPRSLLKTWNMEERICICGHLHQWVHPRVPATM